MCITFCHRRRLLYQNHEDCELFFCPFATGPYPSCQSCCHRRDGRCALTNAELPAQGGCCHHNVEPAEGPQSVGREMVEPLGLAVEDTELYVLRREAVIYDLRHDGTVTVNPDELGLPYTYGLGTDHMPVADLDWSGWTQQWWCDREPA